MIIILFTFIFVAPLFSQENCSVENPINHRSIYSIGETLSEDDQNKVLDYAKDNKCRVTILSQITKKENELSKIAQSRLEKLRSESR